MRTVQLVEVDYKRWTHQLRASSDVSEKYGTMHLTMVDGSEIFSFQLALYVYGANASLLYIGGYYRELAPRAQVLRGS